MCFGQEAYGDYRDEEAEKHLLKALDINPNSYEAMNLLCAIYYWQDRKTDWATTKMEELVQLHPDYVYGLGSYGAFLIRKGDFEKAISYIQKALVKHKEAKRDTSIAWNSYLLSIAFGKNNNMQAARSSLTEANSVNLDRSKLPQRFVQQLATLREQAERTLAGK